jgi:hypothetical protein
MTKLHFSLEAAQCPGQEFEKHLHSNSYICESIVYASTIGRWSHFSTRSFPLLRSPMMPMMPPVCAGVPQVCTEPVLSKTVLRSVIFGAHGRTKSEEFGPGQVAFIKQGLATSQSRSAMSRPKYFWCLIHLFTMRLTFLPGSRNPAYLLADNFGITKELVEKLPKQTVGFAPRVA